MNMCIGLLEYLFDENDKTHVVVTDRGKPANLLGQKILLSTTDCIW